MNAMYWLILLIVLVVIEIITLGLTTIWFAGGALVTFILAMLVDFACDSVGSVLRGVSGAAFWNQTLGCFGFSTVRSRRRPMWTACLEKPPW